MQQHVGHDSSSGRKTEMGDIHQGAAIACICIIKVMMTMMMIVAVHDY